MISRLSLATLLSFVVMIAGCNKKMESAESTATEKSSTEPKSSESEKPKSEKTDSNLKPEESDASMAEIVDELKLACGELAKAFADSDKAAADKVFHDKIQGSIGAIDQAIKKLEGEKVDKAESLKSELMDVLIKLHQPLHDKDATIEPADFEADEENLNKALDKLEEFAKSI